MKQRITYLLPPGTGLQADDIHLKDESLSFAKARHAVEEWKFTLGVEELPDEVFSYPVPSLSLENSVYQKSN